MDAAAYILAQTQRQVAGFADIIVDLAGLPPETEFSGADIAVHALGCRADTRQLVIMNGSRSIHREVIDVSALHQIDDVAGHPPARGTGAAGHPSPPTGPLRAAQPPPPLAQTAALTPPRLA